MIDILKNAWKFKVKPLNIVKIYESSIKNNVKILQNIQKKSVLFPVLKSNAYGHWLKEVSKIFKNIDVPYIAVDSFPEYEIVKKYSWKRVLILWETFTENYQYYDFKKATFCISSLETLQELVGFKEKIKVHLFLNTWMNREGFSNYELSTALNIISNSHLELEWVLSHFSSADEKDFSCSEEQIKIFKKMYRKIENEGFRPKYRHIWASAGTLKVRDDFFNAFRPGISIFWINPLDEKDDCFSYGEKLTPAMEIFSTITKVQKVDENQWISYNHTYITKNKEEIAVIPFGYYEWFSRKFSDKLSIDLWGFMWKIRGRVCMNLSIIALEKKKEIWDRFCILTREKNKKNNIYNWAKIWETIPYEVMVKIHPSIHREIVKKES